MSIWILAIFVIVALALTGWRQGAIRAAFNFVGILFAALLAAPVGRMLHPLLPHLGASNPVMAWALAPIFGFIVASIPLLVAGQMVHNRVEHFYKYKAGGDLRLALYARLNSRCGICIGVLNGVVYFILLSFYIYNLTYWTTQAAPAASTQPFSVRMANSLGEGLQSSGFAKTASAVGTLPPRFYRLADFSGLILQNPQLAPRLAEYPAFVALGHRDEMQPLVTDPVLTNALASGSTLSDIVHAPSVQDLFANKDLSKMVLDAVETNMDDLTAYLNTGKSAKYGGQIILGTWQFNAEVTMAWLRQQQPKMAANEMGAIRGLWSQAYAHTTLLMTADNQLYVKNLPKFMAQPQPNQPPFQAEDWKGDWSLDGTNYTLHIAYNGEDKYMIGTTDPNGLRLRIKDGRNILVFDHTE